MKVKLIIISIILLLVMVFASGCIPVMEKLGLVNPTNEEQLSPEKAGPPDGLVKVLIGFKEKPGPAEQALVKGLGGKIKYTYNLIPAIAASVPEVAIEALKKNPNISNVELDNQVFALEDTQTLPWGVNRIDAEVVHSSGNKGAGVQVAIIDTGIDYTHPDLDDNYYGGWDFVNNDGDPMDDEGHGTHVAGIIAAEDNEEGVVGVAPQAELYALKVLDEEGYGYVSDVVYAIQWSTVNGIKVINMSLGGKRNIFLEWACNLAYYSDGLLLVAAAGNGGAVIYPAAYSSVIAVSATNSNDELAWFSSTGKQVELAAPGVSIDSTVLNGGYGEESGTSMSSPHVAGTAALAWKANPSWSNDEVRAQLQNTADDLGAAGWDSEFGYGLVNAAEAAGVETPLPGAIAGKVTANDGLVIVGATVVVEGITLPEAITDENGDYTINNVPVGNYTVTASATGYIEESLPAEVSQGQTTVVNFVLIPTSVVPTLYVNVVTNKASYVLRETVYITVIVTESNESGQPVEGAIVQAEITTDSGRKYTKDGVTGSNGEVTFKFKTKKPDGKGTYSITANASKSGYEPGSDSTTFDVN